MKTFKLKRTTLAFLGVAFVAIGTYNSVVVNSDAFMDGQSVRFVKRLDELNGEYTAGRKLANNGEWVKLRAPVKFKPIIAKDEVTLTASAPSLESSAPVEDQKALAAIKEDLSLELVEVFNAKKYANPPKAGEFGGTLSAQEGVIESLSVSLPNNEGISISFSEMTGNVFEYDLDGQTLSGMMYQMDKSSYMITLTNGPYEGTRLKFAATNVVEENFGNNSAEIAENNADAIQAEEAPQPEPEFASIQNDDGTQQDVGTFGAEPMQQPTDVAQNEVPQAPEGGYVFNFDQQSTTF